MKKIRFCLNSKVYLCYVINENVILVDENDREIGICEKLEAHQKGLLHRAFSIFIFNEKNELILQKRAAAKYHSAGLWSNTCCGHPRPGETILEAANRRLMEEMNLQCELQFKFSFIYKTKLNDELWEHELDHVFIGKTSALPKINPEEVSGWKAENMDAITKHLMKNPKNYSAWFGLCIEKINTTF